MTAPQRPATSFAALHIIRLAMFGGALLFGIVTYWLRREAPPPLPPEMGPLRFAGYGLWVSVLVLLAFLRGIVTKATDQGRRVPMLIVAWARPRASRCSEAWSGSSTATRDGSWPECA